MILLDTKHMITYTTYQVYVNKFLIWHLIRNIKVHKGGSLLKKDIFWNYYDVSFAFGDNLYRCFKWQKNQRLQYITLSGNPRR